MLLSAFFWMLGRRLGEAETQANYSRYIGILCSSVKALTLDSYVLILQQSHIWHPLSMHRESRLCRLLAFELASIYTSIKAPQRSTSGNAFVKLYVATRRVHSPQRRASLNADATGSRLTSRGMNSCFRTGKTTHALPCVRNSPTDFRFRLESTKTYSHSRSLKSSGKAKLVALLTRSPATRKYQTYSSEIISPLSGFTNLTLMDEEIPFAAQHLHKRFLCVLEFT